MRRKIKHRKRYKDYPKNVPRKLLKLFFSLNCSVSRLAIKQGVNSGHVSALLNEGTEPKQEHTRKMLLLPIHPICSCCGRKIIKRKPTQRKEEPEYMKVWKHLPKEKRQRAIEVYVSWLPKEETVDLYRTKQKRRIDDR